MGIMRRVGEWLGLATFAADETAPRPIADVLLEMNGRGLLPRVGRNEAISVPAVLKGRNLVASLATLPLVQRDADLNTVRLSLLEQIDPNVANVVTLAQTFEDLFFEGLSWWRITAFGADGYPTSAEHLDLSQVSLQPPPGRLAPLPSGYDPRGAVVYVDGVPFPAELMIRFDSPNPGLLHAGGRAVRRAVLLDTTSALYADNPRPLDYFTPSEGSDPTTDEDVQQILNDWAAARKRRGTAYVPAALTYNTVDTPTPVELQLVELQRKATLDLANAMGLDPEDLGISTTSRTYQNATDRRRDRINDVLAPYMAAVTDRLSMGDVTKRGYRIAFDLDEYLRADPKTRVEYYQRGIEDGWLVPEEARTEEGKPPMTAAQKASMKPAAPAVAAPAQPMDNVRPLRAVMAADPDALTFDVDVQPLVEVNRERRIIEGIVLPYGKLAWKNGVRYRFQAGSLQFSDLRRVKLLRDHDQSQVLGRLVFAEDRPEGMFARFQVADGPDGDRALAEAAGGLRDGFSVGAEIGQADPDPENRGAFLVSTSAWRETSVLAVPAFDDARVTRVAASADQGDQMDPCSKCGQRHAPSAACPAPPQAQPEQATNPPEQQQAPTLNLTNEQMQALLGDDAAARALLGFGQPATQQQGPAQFGLTHAQVVALTEGGHIQRLMGIGQPAPEQRQTVDPTRRPAPAAAVSVREPSPYRFDAKGNLTAGTHDFSTDLIMGFSGDTAALERATAFTRSQWDSERTEFATAMTDVAPINPNRQRPDLYVDQQEFEYPIWNAINKGTIPDATPFVLPKFNTSSGLVGAHVENTEPTPGAFTATAQTITPSAVSGKVEISREAWDQGGNPQLSGLIWRQMVRAWFEALEAASVALLEAAAPTTLTITTAAADAALEASLTSQLAPLQYVRGGFRMRDAFAQVDLYKALIAAKDSNGRKLFPVVNAQNATGTTQDFFSAVLVAGLVMRPAWALAATSANSANSYLFDRGDVSGWATAPSRLTMENISVAKIHMGIWGYKALAITDITGVRRLAYDPV